MSVRVSQATGMSPREATHWATAVDLPQPGPAETTVSRRMLAESNRRSSSGRAMVPVEGTGTDQRASSTIDPRVGRPELAPEGTWASTGDTSGS